MIAANIRVMALLLRRDRPTLVLLFLLPPLVFVVLTAVFRESVTRVPDVDIAILDTAARSGGEPLDAAFARAQGLKIGRPAADLSDLRDRIARGETEVGVVIDRGDGGADDMHRWTLLTAPGHEGMAQLVTVRIMAVTTQPEAADRQSAGPIFVQPAIETVDHSRGDPVVLDEVGAIAAMFLMLSGIQVAATLVDERESGIYDRVAGSGSIAGLVLGKFVFGMLIGTVQAALIIVTARLVFHADVLAAPTRLAIACGLTAAMATSLTLFVAACCSTRQQAQAISTFGIMILSTLGGSMVPLRFMPPWLAGIGRFTPNAWSVDAFRDATTGGPDWRSPHPSWVVITVITAVALILALGAYRRRPVL